jgi:hypothetical protein
MGKSCLHITSPTSDDSHVRSFSAHGHIKYKVDEDNDRDLEIIGRITKQNPKEGDTGFRSQVKGRLFRLPDDSQTPTVAKGLYCWHLDFRQWWDQRFDKTGDTFDLLVWHKKEGCNADQVHNPPQLETCIARVVIKLRKELTHGPPITTPADKARVCPHFTAQGTSDYDMVTVSVTGPHGFAETDSVQVSSSGDWSAPFSGLRDGTTYVLTATDMSGPTSIHITGDNSQC